MITHPAALQADIDAGCTTFADAMIIERVDAQVFGYTSAVESETVDGVLCAGGSLDVKNLVIPLGFAVGNTELRILHDGTVVKPHELFSKVWDNADFRIIRYNWAAVAHGLWTRLTGKFGTLKLSTGEIVIELRSLNVYFENEVGLYTSKNCQNRLGDAKCTIDLDPLRVTSQLTDVASRYEIEDSSLVGEVADYFGKGTIRFTSGLNSGMTFRVRAFTAGVFTLETPLWQDAAIGDDFVATPGCRGRVDEDCFQKFDNVLNFRGHPHMSTIDDVTKGVQAEV